MDGGFPHRSHRTMAEIAAAEHSPLLALIDAVERAMPGTQRNDATDGISPDEFIDVLDRARSHAMPLHSLLLSCIALARHGLEPGSGHVTGELIQLAANISRSTRAVFWVDPAVTGTLKADAKLAEIAGALLAYEAARMAAPADKRMEARR